jgi:epoxyqueuosine reductase
MLEKRLRDWAAARGYGIAIAGIGVIEAVREKLEARRSSGEIEAGFYKENLDKFRFLEGIVIPGPKCVVMVAVPCPIHVLPVTVGGRKIDALIPPTYVKYNATFADVLGDMKETALGTEAAVETIKAPLKSLAVHMGLVVYGRNNITYVPGLGSGHQLCGYVVGMGEGPVEGDAKPSSPKTGEGETGPAASCSAPGAAADWRETALERCADCRACVKACPTGAIREDRFLISAERCFTLLSESRKPLPAWAKPPKSICLIGCMACQQVCPENKGRLKTSPSGLEFTAGETEAVLEAGRRLAAGEPASRAGDKRAGKDPAFESVLAKFETLGLTEDLDVMGRNLDFFLKGR